MTLSKKFTIFPQSIWNLVKITPSILLNIADKISLVATNLEKLYYFQFLGLSESSLPSLYYKRCHWSCLASKNCCLLPNWLSIPTVCHWFLLSLNTNAILTLLMKGTYFSRLFFWSTLFASYKTILHASKKFKVETVDENLRLGQKLTIYKKSTILALS